MELVEMKPFTGEHNRFNLISNSFGKWGVAKHLKFATECELVTEVQLL